MPNTSAWKPGLQWMACFWFFYSTSFRAATSTFEFSLSFGLLYPFYFYDQLKYKQQYHFLSQWDTCCCGHKLLFLYSPYLSPELQGEQAGKCTLLVPETSLVPCVCWRKAEASCTKAVQIVSQPTLLHCFRSGIMSRSALFR